MFLFMIGRRIGGIEVQPFSFLPSSLDGGNNLYAPGSFICGKKSLEYTDYEAG